MGEGVDVEEGYLAIYFICDIESDEDAKEGEEHEIAAGKVENLGRVKRDELG